MTWTCTLNLVDDCRTGGLFDPPTRVDDQAACRPCAREAKLRTQDHEADYPWKLTD